MAEIRTDKFGRQVGLEGQYFKQRFEAEAEQRDAQENVPRSRISETGVTPLHGLELSQFWVKNLKCQNLTTNTK